MQIDKPSLLNRAYLTVRNLIFQGNGIIPDQGWEEQDGGCFLIDGVDFVATDCVFTGWTVEDNGYGDGGIIVAYES